MESTKALFGELLKQSGYITQGMLDFALKVQSSGDKTITGALFRQHRLSGIIG